MLLLSATKTRALRATNTASCPGSKRSLGTTGKLVVLQQSQSQGLDPRICFSMKLLKNHQKSPSILRCKTAAVRNSPGLSRAPDQLGICLKLSPPSVLFVFEYLHYLVALVLWCCRLPELLESKSPSGPLMVIHSSCGSAQLGDTWFVANR